MYDYLKMSLLLLGFLMSPLYACGPDFPNSFLVNRSEILTAAFYGHFEGELSRIPVPMKVSFKAFVHKLKPYDYAAWGIQYHLDTATCDINDLQKALASSQMRADKAEEILSAYKVCRKEITEHAHALTLWQRRQNGERPKFVAPKLDTDGMPAEFVDYVRGAIAYYLGETAQAMAAWQSLLQRPKEERHYRSTWAAFMLGKVLLEKNGEEAMSWFRKVRDMALEGYSDSLGLASSSLGWEAYVLLQQAKYAEAMELYLTQYATGDPTASASLQMAVEQCWQKGAVTLAQIAQNRTARQVVTAYIISAGGPYRDNGVDQKLSTTWLEVVEKAKLSLVEEADRLAWAAYSMGDMTLVARWLELAPADATITRWIRSKLLLRAGKIEDAAAQLAPIVKKFPSEGYRDEYSDSWYYFQHTYSETSEDMRAALGVLQLAQQQYTEALDSLLRGNFWEDAAYVAERVLTIEEFKKYVDSTWQGAGERAQKIRYVLARRLTRAGRFQEARAYYPAPWQEKLDVYSTALQKGRDQSLPARQRIDALWQAAKIARYQGLELMGTENTPDGFMYGGSYYTADIEHYGRDGLLVSKDEKERARQHKPDPDKRFHYRYIAARIAWEAASLLPNHNDETARILCLAGTWIKILDPKEADKFYKALVRRCRKTKLGSDADARRWFPPIKEED